VLLLPNVASKSVENIKKAALDAVKASMPSGVYFGTVTSISPLKITVEQKMTLTDKQLVLSSLVKDFKVDMTLNDTRQNVTIHLGLKSGEKVMLLRVQGGQQFIVLDRVR
jgi:hypothetical protein